MASRWLTTGSRYRTSVLTARCLSVTKLATELLHVSEKRRLGAKCAIRTAVRRKVCSPKKTKQLTLVTARLISGNSRQCTEPDYIVSSGVCNNF
ncbi:tRNA pseudouridine synthase [Aspergillus luchuensis]|uniref:tRNA pseudouridine synthase n=1 Tax=Aspergillus kawachii TaxID=1069201 RepID=A0A146FYY6_ASPKA|nr:tRNA pseudouridine synthase [Aspergillus luchuensis]